VGSDKLYTAGFILLVSVSVAVIVIDVRHAYHARQDSPAQNIIKIDKGSIPPGCSFSDTDSPILTGTLHQVGKPDKNIRLPRAYLPGSSRQKDGYLGTDGTLLMQMQVETFSPYPTAEMRGKIAKNENDRIMLLITQLKPLDWIAQFIAEFNSGKPEGTKFREIPQANGLLKLDYTPLLRMKEAFIAREDHQITDVIDCSVDNDPHIKIYPNCEQTTSASGIDIQIVYPVRELDNWRAIRERARKFIACTIIDENILMNTEN
jgi:hypothetical protein